MNVETGEVRRMDEIERQLLNEKAGRPLWEPVAEELARDAEHRSYAVNCVLPKSVMKNLRKMKVNINV